MGGIRNIRTFLPSNSRGALQLIFFMFPFLHLLDPLLSLPCSCSLCSTTRFLVWKCGSLEQCLWNLRMCVHCKNKGGLNVKKNVPLQKCMWHFMVIFPHFKKCSWHLKNVLYSVKKVCGGKKCLFLLKYVYEISKKYTSVSTNCPWNFQKCLYNVKKKDC